MGNKTTPPVVSPGAVLVVTTIASFFSTFASSALYIALPNIGSSLHIGATGLNWTITIFLLANASCMLPAGRIADLYGRKRVFLIGSILYALCAGAVAVSSSLTLILVLRFFQGVAAALFMSTSSALLTSVFPPERRGFALGINVAAINVGLSAGPFLGGLLTAGFGWRSVFGIGIALGIVNVPLVLKFLQSEWKDAHGEHLDCAGMALYMASLGMVVVGFSQLPSVPGIVLMLAGVAGLVVFIRNESRSKQPMLKVTLFSENRVFALSNLAAFASYAATFSTSFFLSLWLQGPKGFRPEAAGLVLVMQPMLQALFSPLAGRLSDHVQARIPATTGMLLVGCGLLILTFVSAESPIIQVLMALSFMGIGFALFSSPNTNSVMGSVQSKELGIASATVGTMRTLGQVSSMALALLLSTLAGGATAERSINHPGSELAMHLSFSVSTLICLSGALASFVRGNNRKVH